MLLVCFAVPEEAAPFKKRVQIQDSIAVLVTGMGHSNARAAIIKALNTSRPSLVITSGFAGGLNPSLKHQEIIGSWDETFPDSLIKRSGAKPVRFHCSDRVISHTDEKRRLFQANAGDAVEMESQIIRAECALKGIPSATLRIVLDPADESLPIDFEEVLGPSKQMDWAKFAIWLVKHPAAVPKLIALNKRVRDCARRLSDSLWAALEENLVSAQPKHQNQLPNSEQN